MKIKSKKKLKMLLAEVGTCGAFILLAIVLASKLFLSGCAASILAIFGAIPQAQFKYD